MIFACRPDTVGKGQADKQLHIVVMVRFMQVQQGPGIGTLEQHTATGLDCH
jgi:hypothetical protein